MKKLPLLIALVAMLGLSSCHHNPAGDNVWQDVATSIQNALINVDDDDYYEDEEVVQSTTVIDTTTNIITDSTLTAVNDTIQSVKKALKAVPNITVVVNADEEDEMSVAVIAIVFGTILAIVLGCVVAVIVFLLKRNRMRNRVIEMAIENDYQLPEAFYLGGHAADTSRGRNPALLQKAWKNIAVGLCLFLAFAVNECWFVAFCCSIPGIIGIGQLISYFTSKGGHDSTPPFPGSGQNQPPYPPYPPMR
ncbi:MAG: DUF6249 domain-containing protein [Bacteroidales bacterium]|nr:DUF6249 domain-containing protein [Bacteroidales bacterium]